MNESTTVNAMTGFSGPGIFVIVNASGIEMKNVRLTHFMEGKSHEPEAELAIVDKLAIGGRSQEFTFKSVDTKDDHWCVAFQNVLGCWQSYDLDSSMGSEYDPNKYQLIISNEELTLVATYKKGGSTHSKSKSIVSVYHGTKVG